MKKKLYIAKKACLDSKTGKIYYKCEIDGEDIYAALASNNVAHDAVGAIVSAIDDPEKTAVTEVEIEEEDIVHDYSKDEDEACAPSRWTSDPEYKYEHTHAYAWPNLLAKAAEIREKHPEGATGQLDEDGWILFLQHEADQAAEELEFDMNDFYENYAKKRGFMVLENTAGPYHIKPYDFSLSGDPVPDSWPY